MDKGKRLPPQSMDMQISTPKKAVCQSCRFRMNDTVIRRADGSKVVIEQWNNSECEKYEDKPLAILFDNEGCVFYERG